MHSKTLGVLGESRVLHDLIRQEFPVFKEFGDNSKVDLIAIIDKRPVTIQVKCVTLVSGAARLNRCKAGPNYRFKYTEEDCDVFAMYIYERDIIVYVTSKELCQYSTGMTFRIDPSKNGQDQNIRNLKGYTDIREVLRGHEPNPLTDNAEGDDMVQTTTEMASES